MLRFAVLSGALGILAYFVTISFEPSVDSANPFIALVPQIFCPLLPALIIWTPGQWYLEHPYAVRTLFLGTNVLLYLLVGVWLYRARTLHPGVRFGAPPVLFVSVFGLSVGVAFII